MGPGVVVVLLFARALELKIAHNYFGALTVTSSQVLGGQRPVDALSDPAPHS
ncbi:hypothetical protein [Pseudarthrobacter sp. N5]|uniref:hypothetical protein n=1 Tax=Pseudarthrobacter sp. N5 TaxID=3418416 RepID=UPI003CE85F01